MHNFERFLYFFIFVSSSYFWYVFFIFDLFCSYCLNVASVLSFYSASLIYVQLMFIFLLIFFCELWFSALYLIQHSFDKHLYVTYIRYCSMYWWNNSETRPRTRACTHTINTLIFIAFHSSPSLSSSQRHFHHNHSAPWRWCSICRFGRPSPDTFLGPLLHVEDSLEGQQACIVDPAREQWH